MLNPHLIFSLFIYFISGRAPTRQLRGGQGRHRGLAGIHPRRLPRLHVAIRGQERREGPLRKSRQVQSISIQKKHQ